MKESEKVCFQEACEYLENSEVIVEKEVVAESIDRLAKEVSDQYADRLPVVLTVMGGGLIFSGQLLTRLFFPLECDYLHVTRYSGKTQGGKVVWVVSPKINFAGRDVIVVDDILDHGITWKHIKQYLLEHGAKSAQLVVLCDKVLDKKHIEADFIGFSVPDRYVFGCGMDINEYWRNLPEVRALRDA